MNIGSGSSASLSIGTLTFTNDGNFKLEGVPYYTFIHNIVSVGPVAGLGFINTIPQEGWTGEVAAQVGNGYIIRSDVNTNRVMTYCRIYVVGYNDAGGITIKYQVWDGIPQ